MLGAVPALEASVSGGGGGHYMGTWEGTCRSLQQRVSPVQGSGKLARGNSIPGGA